MDRDRHRFGALQRNAPKSTVPERDALAFLQQDHLREREICTLLDRIATEGTASREDAVFVADFLRHELPLHLTDEKEDLYPMIRKRCEPEDELSEIIGRLLSDHCHADEETPAVLAILDGLITDGESLTETKRSILRRYASHARRHLSLENAILMPFARLRLTLKDRKQMCRNMMRRRGATEKEVLASC